MDNKKFVKEKYSGLASEYDIRWAEYLNSTHNAALKLLKLDPLDRVLSVGGGTGLLEDKMLMRMSKNGSLTLTDICQEMIDIARKRLKIFPQVQFLQNDIHSLSFKSYSFDKLLSVNSLHYYSDVKIAISEFYRVLEPKGELVIVDWCRDPIRIKLYDKINRLIDNAYVKTYTSDEIQDILIDKKFKVDEIRKWNHGFWSLMGIRAKKI